MFIRNAWYVAAWADEIGERPLARRICNEPVVLYRDANGEAAALISLLAEDYTAITAQGAIQTKEQALSSLRSGTLQLTGLSISDRKVRVYGSTAVVTSVAELTGSRNNKEVTGKYRYTRVYVRNSQGQWKIVSFEASRIQDSGEHK